MASSSAPRRDRLESEDVSEGSDIFDDLTDETDESLLEEEEEEEVFDDPNYIPPPAPLDRAQLPSWLTDSDSDDDAAGPAAGHFHGFQDHWISDPESFNSTEKSRFRKKPGVKINIAKDASPGDAFGTVFTDALWSRLVEQTNIFAEQTRPAPRPESKMGKWKKVTPQEMKTFVGLCIAMGIIKLPYRRDYWRQKKPLFKTGLPEIMSRDRFGDIWR